MGPGQFWKATWGLPAAAGAAISLLGASMAVAGPVLHEFVQPNPADDLAHQATTPDGALPAAIKTPSGVVAAPGQHGTKDAGRDYAEQSSTRDRYSLDGDTSRPDLVDYDDPFIPAVTPFKRLHAYDAVDEDLRLIVSDRRLNPLPLGQEASPGQDQFYADLRVQLSSAAPVRIPSPGPGAVILGTNIEPEVEFTVERDGADNWFVRASEGRRVRLVLRLAVDRAVFGSDLADLSWDELPRVPRLPRSAMVVADDVLDHLAVSRRLRPRDAVRRLVAYFRSFQAEDRQLTAASAADLYRQVAMSQKGVCRHRSYAFMLTALRLGIPTRMVHNEAHAWVEVNDGRSWHRLDLGGAAARMELTQSDAGPRHVPPPDSLPWPRGAEPGTAMTDRALQGRAASPSASLATPQLRSTSRSPAAGSADADADADAPLRTSTDDRRPASKITVKLGAPRPGKVAAVARGASLEVSGEVRAGSSPCRRLRVDFSLVSRPDGSASRPIGAVRARSLPLGALSTDDAGRFSGRLLVGPDVAVGDHVLSAHTKGNQICGPGRSR